MGDDTVPEAQQVIDYWGSHLSTEYDDFVGSLWSDSNSTYAIISGNGAEARLCAERHRDRDGLICHFFSGHIIDKMSRDASHTFLVTPGVWAATLIREFSTKVGHEVRMKGPLFPEDGGEVDVDVQSKFTSGALGVVLEMSPSDALQKLRRLETPDLKYRLVRFYSLR